MRKYHNHWATHILMGIFLSTFMWLFSSCEEVGPEPSPELTYPLVDRTVEVDGAAGEVTFAPFTFWGMKDNPFVPFVFIKEYSPLSEYNCELFVNRQEDMSSRLQGLDVKYYCEENGISESLDSQESPIPYKWVAISSFIADDKEQKLVVRYEENTTSRPREMYVHFYDGRWGVVCIRQDKQ